MKNKLTKKKKKILIKVLEDANEAYKWDGCEAIKIIGHCIIKELNKETISKEQLMVILETISYLSLDPYIS